MSDTGWIEVTAETPEALAESAAALLMDAGVQGVQTITKEALPPGQKDDLEGRARLRFYLPLDTDPEGGELARFQRIWREFARHNGLADALGLLHAHPLENTDWTSSWRRFFKPKRIGERLLVRPSWESGDLRPGDAVIELDPGLAFGTGGHGTTSMILARIERLSMDPGLPARILDVGTGSGILAIAAVKLGAGSVLATDNDPEAVRVARENVSKNGLDESRIAVSDTDVSAIAETFPLVLANILSSILLEMKDHLRRLTAPGGRLILSGLLDTEEKEIMEAFTPLGFRLEEVRHWEEWIAMDFIRQGD